MKLNLSIVFLIAVAMIFISNIRVGADQEASIKPSTPAKPLGAKAHSTIKPDDKIELIDLNSAKKEELMTLHGIGDTIAQKIIDGRPYAKKDQLKSRKIISAATYDKIKDKIIAKQRPMKKLVRSI